MREEREEILRERVLLVGIDTGEDADFDRSMEELALLADACERQVAGTVTQKLESVNKALYIGSGKVEEVRALAEACGADAVLFDNSLTPSQVRNLNRELKLPVLDRTSLILDIFALRARTREAKLQVELARLKYLLPRLTGMHEALTRQGGASGSMSSRGAGEKQLELDRRRIEHRIAERKKELEGIARSRQTQRRRRCVSSVPQAALVGYTNAGKSTILNRMVALFGAGEGKQVVERDMLFATLDTSVRYLDTGDHRPFFLADTVGFIHKLPHSLIEAFHSTLEEVKYADLLIQVVDVSDPDHRRQMKVTEETLKELGAGEIPRLLVYNKADRRQMEGLPRIRDGQIYMNAADGVGIRELAEMVKEIVYRDRSESTFFIPYDQGGTLSFLLENGTVSRQEYREDGVLLRLSCHRRIAERCRAFRLESWP